jgi:predicted anti-sigma-YlaC factor YlaD
MTEINCESVRIAAMALADNEESPLGTEEIETHLRNCEGCRAEIVSLGLINELLSSQKRLEAEANVWPAVSERLVATPSSAPPFRWRVLLFFGIPLFGYKILLLVLQTAPSLWSKLVPIVLVIAVFGYLKTNPFKINCELTLRGELSS